MMIDASTMDHKILNQAIRMQQEDVLVHNCLGERYIGCGANNKTITIQGTPGNALGCYLDGAHIFVEGNAQDALGDTMNDGEIVVHGNAGDACGYAMRGGNILIRGHVGYRCGIHMKAYEDKQPMIVIGKDAGSFLGEYLAGGTIVVLGLGQEDIYPVGNFIGTGMYDGEIFIRSNHAPSEVSEQLHFAKATALDMQRITPILRTFSSHFDIPLTTILDVPFTRITPNYDNPYHMLYTEN